MEFGRRLQYRDARAAEQNWHTGGHRSAGIAADPVEAIAELTPQCHDVTCNPWSQRRALLEGVWLDCRCARLADVFDDHALFDAVVEHGLEGIVAKRLAWRYRPRFRGWTKVKIPGHWRRESEIAHMQRSLASAGRVTPA